MNLYTRETVKHLTATKVNKFLQLFPKKRRIDEYQPIVAGSRQQFWKQKLVVLGRVVAEENEERSEARCNLIATGCLQEDILEDRNP